ncbi:TonB-dependent receptor [Eudoraea chungangensis]|uniref:TonB-dependent receptor n=1 Tax=Eudoraea chungangensis TaxID=1481905 RepID=UPI0023EBF69B|nr:TonB-dependent receptor [Eudoraea chungangensis]
MIIFLWIIPVGLCGQDFVEGMVMEANNEDKHIGLPGANVYWMNSPIGTITADDGSFKLPYSKNFTRLIISYVGFQTDTLSVNNPQMIHHWLKPSNELEEVVVSQKRDALQKTFFSAQNVVTVNSAELLKAACCNLAESFETNPSIDVNYSDALTGTKQIQMLGLTSPYLLITQENIPMVRGASQTFGLTYTPGTWIESIQISKGAGSVVNGYESISGQINTELLKPFTETPLFLNAYVNRNGRIEINTHLNHKLSEKWSSGLFIHGNGRNTKVDENDDGFLDVPLASQINILNRWQYQDVEKGWVSFINIRALKDEKQLGQVNFNPLTDKFTTNAWGSEINTRRFDTSMKLGYVFPSLPFQSFGFQTSYSYHKQDSYFGFNQYDIRHESVYSNFIFNSILGDTRNKFKTGITYAYDGYEEEVNLEDYRRVDTSIGAFFEYSYDQLDKVSLTAGIRIDAHNRLGTFVSPRFHIRYTPWPTASIRGSFGRGRRAANIFAENQQMFASSREIVLRPNGGEVYGFDPEDAWNYGMSFLQRFTLFNRLGNISADFYRTDFVNQIVVDWENPRQVQFSNLDGKSYANSLQLEFNYEILDGLDLRTAYKYYDVKTEYSTGLLQKPIQPEQRFFLNLGYETPLKENGAQWRFDYTFNRIGRQRLPDTSDNPEAFRLSEFSSAYSLMNAQITKSFNNSFEIYAGAENITNFRQENPVLGSQDPFGPYFDTTIVFAPVLGSMYYAGFRFKL